MPSFIEVVNDLVSALQANTALDTFCKEKWNKSLLIKKMFKYRTEIQITDLPIILVTRPQKLSKDFPIGNREYEDTVRLYCGFHQPDRDIAQDEMIEFEEKIDDAVLEDRDRNGLVLDTNVTMTVTDEGYFHPVYFVVKEVTIETRKIY